MGFSREKWLLNFSKKPAKSNNLTHNQSPALSNLELMIDCLTVLSPIIPYFVIMFSFCFTFGQIDMNPSRFPFHSIQPRLTLPPIYNYLPILSLMRPQSPWQQMLVQRHQEVTVKNPPLKLGGFLNAQWGFS